MRRSKCINLSQEQEEEAFHVLDTDTAVCVCVNTFIQDCKVRVVKEAVVKFYQWVELIEVKAEFGQENIQSMNTEQNGFG